MLGVTGSVSAYRAPDIARLLMRHGAEVHCFPLFLLLFLAHDFGELS
ncbi:MAG: hypothetical protein KGI38_03475 [Thaumarchaeota archaeon]|nr:hypothetical protein [Nitrososphaerota archaeon]